MNDIKISKNLNKLNDLLIFKKLQLKKITKKNENENIILLNFINKINRMY
jgi:hypothetical protein